MDRDQSHTAETLVERTRARAGFLVVFCSDLAIFGAALAGVLWLRHGTGSNATEVAAILTSAFTTIGTMTTAYFGIKSMSNTAVSLRQHEPKDPPTDPEEPATRPR
ncbi:hypothetical protein CFP65_6133 [Kitasatospora sp. MMS16-BH015]|uniref:hypothetical protein n=1 Tax=Kitasatospora sp. MMS16-BH015 TaxID=2018025 RepID=UPI000CA3A040|nr:hypothetical protein [Kitasatospora sp. MMS16-BH015]AUG80800.1 hypothetical protein CFP65_6133 [Kitasatospora sp. MMS16-BH015]